MNTPHISFPPSPPELKLKRAAERSAAGAAGPLGLDEARLAAAWEKLHRSRALLETEQAQICQERAAMEQARVALHRLEADIAEREAAVAIAEERLHAKDAKPKKRLDFTRVPFGFGRAAK